MPFVQAKCPNCSGALSVDNNLEAAICPYCNTPYIVEKAIYNYSVNVQGTVVIENAVIMNSNAENLAKRGEEFEKAGDTDKAIDYYNNALDLDINCALARAGIDRIKKEKQDFLISGMIKKAYEQEKDNINNSLMIYDEILKIEPNNVKAKEGIDRITEFLKSFNYFTSKAKSIKENGIISLSFTNFTFVSKNGNTFDFAIEAISDVGTKENMRFSGESFGRTKPNSIWFLYINESSRIEYEYKVHNATELMLIIKALQDKEYQRAINISNSIK